MTDDQWQRIWAAYQQITELPPADRATAVDRAFNDESLKAKLRELLESFASSPDADAIDAPVADPDPAPAFTLLGTSIGRFELRAILGRGGVGEVYRAFDPELEREVAIKCVSCARIGSTNAVADFLHEARAASALNHPGIVTVYEVIRTGETVGIVMELVEGRSLRALTGVPHRIEEVAFWGQRIAEALAATHAGGILHRDIKPENLILRPDGYVKILDFGLAAKRAVEAGGLLAGTVRYMSPEQARGSSTIGPATDIFSLGLVLYELAAGVHPFAPEGRGDTTLSIAAAAATGPVQPPSTVLSSLPRAFDSLVLSMLAKDPAQRPSAQAVADALGAVPNGRVRRRRVFVGGAFAAATFLAAFGLRPVLRPAEPTEMQGTLLTGAPGRESDPAFSPDGNAIAYAWDGGSGGKRDIWIKRLDASDPQRLTTNSADEWNPCWLADGATIAFLRRAPNSYEVVMVPVAGGPERMVTAIGETEPWMDHRLACLASGEDLIVADKSPDTSAKLSMSLYAVSPATGKRRRVSEKDLGWADYWPQVSPDGRRLAFLRVGYGGQIRVTDLAGGPSRLLSKRTGVNGFAWSADSRAILYQLDPSDPKNIWELPVDGGAPRRPPFLTERGATEIAISRSGHKIAYSRGSLDVNLWRVFADGGPPAELAPSIRIEDDGIWSPDGSRFAFVSDRSGPPEIWLASAAGTNIRRVTDLKGGCGSPAWSPDGKWLAFDYSADGGVQIGLVPVDGGSSRLFSDTAVAAVPSWSRDGKWIYFCSRRTGVYEVWRMPFPGGPPIQVTHHGGFESQESADGSFLYYSKMTAAGIWRLPLSGTGSEEQVATFNPEIQFRCWGLAQQGVYIGSPGPKPQIDLLPFAGGRVRIASLPAELPKSSRCFSAHPDGRSFLFPVQEADRQEIYVADNSARK